MFGHSLTFWKEGLTIGKSEGTLTRLTFADFLFVQENSGKLAPLKFMLVFYSQKQINVEIFVASHNLPQFQFQNKRTLFFK